MSTNDHPESTTSALIPVGDFPLYREAQNLVYRLFDEEKTLLYVGRTFSLYTRFYTHSSRTPWWSEVRYFSYEECATYGAATRYEESLIRSLLPPKNKYVPIPLAEPSRFMTLRIGSIPPWMKPVKMAGGLGDLVQEMLEDGCQPQLYRLSPSETRS